MNCFTANTIDDLIYDIYKILLNNQTEISTTRGTTTELVSVHICLNNPLARLSRTETRGIPFSALGELMWYLSGENQLDFIKYYIPMYKYDSEDGKTIYGGYGSRLFKNHSKFDQINQIIKLLRTKPNTRRAVIQIFDSEDINIIDRKEIPCTCTIQFLIRDNKLHTLTNMRSNDAFLGFPHDVFTFTMLQEIIARTLNVELGSYWHIVGSLHLYDRHLKKAQQFLQEGYQSTKNIMPKMPYGNPWKAIDELKEIEVLIRKEQNFDISNVSLDPYWIDLVRLLLIFSLFKKKDFDKIKNIQEQMHNNVYNTYIDTKLKTKLKN